MALRRLGQLAQHQLGHALQRLEHADALAGHGVEDGRAACLAAVLRLSERRDDQRRSGSGARHPWSRFAGFTCLAIAAAGQGIAAFMARGRAAHSASVVAVSFAGRPRLVTLGADGTLVDWDLHLKREDRRRTIPELAGATEFFSGADGGFAIPSGKAVRFAPFADTAVETIPDARHIARGDAVVIARDRALLFASYSDWTKPPYHEFAWPEPILAIAAKDMFVAVADRASISVLDGRPRSVRTLKTVPPPSAISRLEVLPDGIVLALDGSGAGWAIDIHRGVTEPMAAKASLVAGARHVYSVWRREVSEYNARKRTATPLATIGSGARSIDTWGEHVAFGLEGGEVVLGTRTGAKLETTRLTARPGSSRPRIVALACRDEQAARRPPEAGRAPGQSSAPSRPTSVFVEPRTAAQR